MSRFVLKTNKQERDIGKVILQAATAAQGNNHSLSTSDEKKCRRDIRKLMKDSATVKNIVIHVDTPDTINIVVPFLDNLNDFNNKYAKEVLGLAVLRGCGK